MERNSSLKPQSDLILKYLTNGLTEVEQKDFELWLSESQANTDLVESFRDTQKVQKDINTIHSFDTNDAWKKVAEQLGPKPVSIFSFKNVMRYAAAAVLICGTFGAARYLNNNRVEAIADTTAFNIPAGQKRAAFELANGEVMKLNDQQESFKSPAITTKDGTLYFASTDKKEGINMLSTPKAGEYKIVLPDGTQVWLNASSSLRFANSFNKAERKVYLKGEAYFEVAHNKKMPFKVNFNRTEVEVLGTHFNINTYDAKSRTTLLEGAVKIRERGKQQVLRPGEEAIVSAGGIAVAKVETFKTIAWKEGLFLFEEENMVDILDQVARWYDVQIAYDGMPSAKKYSGNIRRQANLNQVLEMLTTVSGSKFTLNDRKLTVKF
jgi:transmembrane sensor